MLAILLSCIISDKYPMSRNVELRHNERGAGARILVTIIEAVKAQGIPPLSLETVSGPSFEMRNG
ncbi:hypothetical protein EN852_004335 [Mesorhizobium sp. M2E.F.Ca.ET.209.01.1.1]|uniref:hypothetical protein n=1 Tax=Mesorhizobium sp. M2E.F.Ca.ET.209.01.1.1 TaxID=2500526 RepID=UPI000FD98405|nr:hypothetical protein [Mesorhizobium sp. M2E.F.Ca.ET.209.01.1.1]TGS17868.1 hypothetical protein EN852_004335 [Mesorhizobium sp. M2E.F.Ca.ET.209.01.1.1]